MDLHQLKLDRNEWNSVEIPVSSAEKHVLDLLIDGYHDVNVKINNNISLITFLKIKPSTTMDDYLFNTYLHPIIKTFSVNDIKSLCSISIKSTKNILSKSDKIRIENNKLGTTIIQENIFEGVLIDLVKNILITFSKNNKKWMQYYYTLCKLNNTSITHINRHIQLIVDNVIAEYQDKTDLEYIVKNSVQIIEKNSMLLKYADSMLYSHQKVLFTIFKNPHFQKKQELFLNKIMRTTQQFTPKLVLYIAPTGTGKTISPIALSEENRVIFVCAARHVGVALAKMAISMGKKIAFAFGCHDAEDIRLHYFAATDYVKNKKSGGIGKVDNSVGDKVEIMICDVKSYLCAMHYMKAFNHVENIITYWDEPTITLDYDEHPLHQYIHNNWNHNEIPNMVLSSATLPKIYELTECIADFKATFPNAVVENIHSYDCNKTIPILNKCGKVVLPHYISNDCSTLEKIIEHCEQNLGLLRYFDLNEIVRFINLLLEEYSAMTVDFDRHFTSIVDINLESIKLYYLQLLKKIISHPSSASSWSTIHDNLCKTQLPYIKKSKESDKDELNSVFITTQDAYTLTEGPTIILTENVTKMSNFYLSQSKIPSNVMNIISSQIDKNNQIYIKIKELEQELERLENKKIKQDSGADGLKSAKNQPMVSTNETKRVHNSIEVLFNQIICPELNERFVPNKPLHISAWASTKDTSHSYTSSIDEETVVKIMTLDINDNWKILLLMGIGVFTKHSNIHYTEIMKSLAEQQYLYLIIASNDYIYGTNYQFCHGYISKDLSLTQEKIIQAMGRIGRNNIQKSYTVRLRDDDQINKIFYPEFDKMEAINMNKLLYTE